MMYFLVLYNSWGGSAKRSDAWLLLLVPRLSQCGGESEQRSYHHQAAYYKHTRQQRQLGLYIKARREVLIIINMSAADQVKLNNFQNIFSLEGKVAVITGGSRGLGLQAASG